MWGTITNKREKDLIKDQENYPHLMEDLNIEMPDDKQVIEFIRSNADKKFGKGFLTSLSDDDITYILDIAYDYYADHGLLELEISDDDSVTEIDKEEMLDYVEKELKKDSVLIASREQLEAVILLESECIEQFAQFDD
ncbi:hypothetical protein HMPREF1869_00204 [Bacteroidales bacterium KA00251]|nr:hypothetical protein HMPREF1869_00204 [Bacteroidales bacterium KA00251]